MKYSLQRIFHNLRYNLPIYVFIAANFMLGAGLFITCMNYVMTSRERLEESRQKKSGWRCYGCAADACDFRK